MRRIRFGLSQKILLGFLVIVIIFGVNVLVTMLTLYNSQRIIADNRKVVNPSLWNIDRFVLMATNSKMYTTNWVYLETNKADMQALRQLHSVEYPALKSDLVSLMQYWEEPALVAEMDSIFDKFEQLLDVQKQIMENLVSFEDYNDPIKKFFSAELLDNKMLPMSTEVIKRLTRIAEKKRTEREASETELTTSFSNLRFIIIALGIVIAVLGIVIGAITANTIAKPLNQIKKVVLKLSEGILPNNDDDFKVSNDEIGDMYQAVTQLVNGLKETSYFAESIGKGDLNVKFKPLSEDDVLGNALLTMRQNLLNVTEDDRKRTWTTEGIAQFGEILRSNNNNLSKLAEEIIYNLVKYLGANQGSLFILGDDLTDEPHMVMMSTYAWDRHKFFEQRIYKGEGLVGQSWQEADTLYITDVPNDYITISSGLGEANPDVILIVPLMSNQQVYGILEIASFGKIEKYQIEFVEKIGESIASTISMVKINERTSKLLEESQMMTEQMRAQEEEMRQNMEELQATQEEMERTHRIVNRREEILNLTSFLVEVDYNLLIVNINRKFASMLNKETTELINQPLSNFTENEASIDVLRASIDAEKLWSGIVSFKTGNKIVKLKGNGGSMDDNGNKTYWLVFNEVSEIHA